MAEFRLGNHDAARSRLSEARAEMAERPDAELRGFAEEAKQLIEK